MQRIGTNAPHIVLCIYLVFFCRLRVPCFRLAGGEETVCCTPRFRTRRDPLIEVYSFDLKDVCSSC